MISTDVLWGGQLQSVCFDPKAQNASIRILVSTDGLEVLYELTCLKVSEFRFENAIREPWSYAEVTEVSTVPLAKGILRLEMMLWSEDCLVQCSCRAIDLHVCLGGGDMIAELVGQVVTDLLAIAATVFAWIIVARITDAIVDPQSQREHPKRAHDFG